MARARDVPVGHRLPGRKPKVESMALRGGKADSRRHSPVEAASLHTGAGTFSAAAIEATKGA
eukprot:12429632-Alexandrium_andersonii.AAC.1